MADIQFKPKSVIFKVTEFFQDPQQLYDRTRGMWKMSAAKANLETLEYAYSYAAKERKIVACYHITKWIGPNEEGRFGFEGYLEFNDPMVGQPCEKIAHARGGVVFYGDNINKESVQEKTDKTLEKPTTNNDVKHKFTVEITTKGSFDVELAYLDPDELEGEIDPDELDTDYVLNYALDEEFEERDSDPFSLKVKDETGNVVFESDELEDFRYKEEFIDYDRDELIDDLDFDEDDLRGYDSKISEVAKEKRENEQEEAEEETEGSYFARIHKNRVRTCTFVIEDTEFHADKFKFIPIGKYSGIYSDSWTDMKHIVYVDRFIEPTKNECGAYDYEQETYDEYGVLGKVYQYEDGEWEFKLDA